MCFVVESLYLKDNVMAWTVLFGKVETDNYCFRDDVGLC